MSIFFGTGVALSLSSAISVQDGAAMFRIYGSSGLQTPDNSAATTIVKARVG